MSSVPPTPPKDLTQILLAWRGGNQEALSQLMPLVYDELRRLAAHYMRRERREHTLQPTALVNEAYLRLVNAKISWQDRAHFFAVVARLMRRLLVDHARASQRDKRGSDATRITLSEANDVSLQPSLDLLSLDEAMTRLAAFDQRKSEIMELHFFGGLGNDEVAEALGISRATVQRDLRLAKAWLKHELRNTQ
jgi:RNA polymerase sigma factor (TIGR02999 family)